jgi:hypothetical protein
LLAAASELFYAEGLHISGVDRVIVREWRDALAPSTAFPLSGSGAAQVPYARDEAKQEEWAS